MATGPNQVWSWDITRLLGPKKWSYFYLYVILDIFSRYAVGWMVADRENSALAGRLIQQSCLKYGVQPRVLTLHSDRGAPMTSQCTAQFKTLKYHPSFPGRFDDQGQAKNFCRSFFPWYNAEHRHGGISMLTPEQLHFGLADEIIARREAVLRAAWAAHPDRFVSGEPKPKPLPEAVWINPPTPTLTTQEIALQLIPPSVSQPLTGSAELEDIAAEAGIDPVYLRRAAMEVDSGVADPSFWVHITGEELMLVRDVTLPGELPDDGFERIVTAIQSHSREHGQPSLLGRTLTWRAETANKSRTIQIVVTSREGHTHVRLEENLAQLAAGIFGGTTGGFGIGIGVGLPIGLEVLGSVLFAVAAPLGMIGLAYLASREIYRRVVRARNRAINDLFERTVAEAQTSIASVAVSGTGLPTALPPGS